MQTLGPRANGGNGSSELELFRQLLGQKEFSIPLGSNFFIRIETIPTAIQNNSTGYFEPGRPGGRGWNIDTATSNLLKFSQKNGNTGACLFANGITPPVESVSVSRVGMQSAYDDFSGGLLDGVVTRSRKQQEPVAISFLETDQSFIDFVIRPWIIFTSHLGLIARAPNSPDNIKTTITAIFFSTHGDGVTPRKVFKFFDCAPVSIDTATAYDYGTNAVNTIKTSWAYNHYSLSTLDAFSKAPVIPAQKIEPFNATLGDVGSVYAIGPRSQPTAAAPAASYIIPGKSEIGRVPSFNPATPPDF
jgi:hypothetical protein